MDFPAPGGWSVERGIAELSALDESRLVGISVCAGNPRRDVDGRGVAALAELIRPFAAVRDGMMPLTSV